MFKSSETEVSIPVEDGDSCACENVTQWLDTNEKYLRQPPAEHYIMTEICDQRFRIQNHYRYQPAPVFLPRNPVKLPTIRYPPMVPVYETPLRKYYADMAAARKGQPGASTSNQTFVQMEPHGPHGSYGYHAYGQNQRTAGPQIQMPAQQPQANDPAKDVSAQPRADTTFVNFF